MASSSKQTTWDVSCYCINLLYVYSNQDRKMGIKAGLDILRYICYGDHRCP